ncbi:hypothetical protein AX15_007905 [Amanita polypyramis BW_CC]|nr:hypothetical protein AX15_007905 [Amanita polypyramis BW_CC]
MSETTHDFVISSTEKTALSGQERSTFKSICIVLTCFTTTVFNIFAVQSSNVALPYIGRDLKIPQDSLQWVASTFALSSGCFLLLCGRFADLYGRKLVFLAGYAWMTFFSLGCGFAQNATQLFIMRGLQGIGSAASITAAVGILAQSFPPGPTRSRAFSTFSVGPPVGGGFGSIFGGLLTQLSAVHWRGIFYLGAGFSTLAFFMGLFSLDRDLPSTEPDRRVDWIGAALVTIGLVMITFVLGQGESAPQKWKTPYIIVLLIVGLFLVLAFIAWEDYLAKHSARPPLMRLDIWTRAKGKFAVVQMIAFLQWCSFSSWLLWVVLYYQLYKGYTPLETMTRLLPAPVTGLVLNFLVGAVVGWLPAIYFLSIGTIATGIACLLFAIIKVDATFWAFSFPSTVLTVWGADFVFACGSLFVARVAHPHEQSVAGGIFQTLTQLGTSFGLAITTIINDRVTSRESVRLGVVPDSQNSNVPPEAQLLGYRAAQWTGFAFAMTALVLSLSSFRGVGAIGGKEEVAVPQDVEARRPSERDQKSSTWC